VLACAATQVCAAARAVGLCVMRLDMVLIIAPSLSSYKSALPDRQWPRALLYF
jgi:hypothetical protein